MTKYFTDKGVSAYDDNAATIEEAKKVLNDKNLCVAVIDNDGEPLRCVKRGEYKEKSLLYNGHVYFINIKK